jgi:hypothetical protein
VADGRPDEGSGAAGEPSLIGESVREGARRMLAEVLRAEVDAYNQSSPLSGSAWWSVTGTGSRVTC